MRRVILKMSMSLDGFVGGPDGEVEWVFSSLDEEASAWTVETLWEAGVHVMGSRTFQDMIAWWPTSTEVYAPPMNEIPKAVFTRSGVLPLPSLELTTRALEDASHVRGAGAANARTGPSILASWTGARVFADLAEGVALLKQEPGKDILAHGGASFARSLISLDLVDEYRLLIHPIALGAGLPIFSGLPRPADLRLSTARAFPAGAVALVYRRR